MQTNSFFFSPPDNGMINKEQFKELMNNFKDKEDDIDRDLWAAFQVFDRDGNGYLTKDELELAMKMMGEDFEEKDINQLMRMTDLDNDGRISFQEFKIKFRMLNWADWIWRFKKNTPAPVENRMVPLFFIRFIVILSWFIPESTLVLTFSLQSFADHLNTF